MILIVLSWPAKLRIFIIWIVIGKVSWPLIYWLLPSVLFHLKQHTQQQFRDMKSLIPFTLSPFQCRCALGYTGSPSSPGGSCQECECDPHGSLPVPCDPVMGLCTCRPGATGPKCDGCEHWHAREGTECICTYTNVAVSPGGPGFISVSFPVRDFFFFLQ